MYRLLLIFILLIFFIRPASSQQFPQLQWAEFCPQNQINAEPMEYKPRNALKDIIYPLIGGDFENTNAVQAIKVNANNYWYQRRMDFQNNLNICNSLKNEDSKVMCYMQLRQTEIYKTAQNRSEVIQQVNFNRQQYQNQQAIDAINRPRTYYNYGNYTYSY